jgi:FkbM family methyltransferase
VGFARFATDGHWVDVPRHLQTDYVIFERLFAAAAPGAALIDVGANVGFVTLRVLAMGHEVLAVEPVPRNFRCIVVAACLNGFSDRLTLVQAASGAAAAHVNIFVPSRADNTALDEAASTAYIGGASAPVRVAVAPLDEILAQPRWAGGARESFVARVALVKIDVQGFELDVLKGAPALLRDLAPGAWVVAEFAPEIIKKRGLDPAATATAVIERMLAARFSVHEEWNGTVWVEAAWRAAVKEDAIIDT